MSKYIQDLLGEVDDKGDKADKKFAFFLRLP